MTIEFHSFTRTWIGFFSGDISEEDLKQGAFTFNCTREYLFPARDEIDVTGPTHPCEITWVNDPGIQPSPHKQVNTGKVPRNHVSGDIQHPFETFLSIVRERDLNGWVTFRDDEERKALYDVRDKHFRDVQVIEDIVTRRWKSVVRHLEKWGFPDKKDVENFYFFFPSAGRHPDVLDR